MQKITHSNNKQGVSKVRVYTKQDQNPAKTLSPMACSPNWRLLYRWAASSPTWAQLQALSHQIRCLSQRICPSTLPKRKTFHLSRPPTLVEAPCPNEISLQLSLPLSVCLSWKGLERVQLDQILSQNDLHLGARSCHLEVWPPCFWSPGSTETGNLSPTLGSVVLSDDGMIESGIDNP